METRLIIAYALIVALFLAAIVFAYLAVRKHREKRRIERGHRPRSGWRL